MPKLEVMKSKDGFLGLEEHDSVPYKDAKIVVIPFGLEASVCFRGGTANGPAAMISASHSFELFDEAFWAEPLKGVGVATLEQPEIKPVIKDALQQLDDIVEDVLKEGKFPMVFGGEHSIVAGSIRPFVRRYPDLAILHFDAHADLRDGYDGEHYSHACALRRCLDHENVRLVSCGIRSVSSSEVPFIEANRDRVNIYWAKDKAKWDVNEIVSHLKGRPIYVTFDVDGFDSSLMPATGTPEPGGLFWDEAISIISAAADVGNIVGGDVNELAPQEGQHSCDFLASKLAYKILSHAFKNKKR